MLTSSAARLISTRTTRRNFYNIQKMALQIKKVLISDEVDPRCMEVLQKNGVEVDKNTKLTKDQLISEIPKYDGLIVRSATKVDKDVIAAATRLQIIGRAGTGVDNIDCNAATQHGVVVMNTPGGNTMSAAEHTCALIMATSRHISNGTQSLREGRWDRKKFMGNEVYGKTLAIIGLGRIGQEVATRMQSFGMTTIGYDPIIGKEEAAKFNVEWMPVDELWERCHYVTVHTPLIPATKNLIGEKVFNSCKYPIRVINCARGGIVDEQALLEALNNGKCLGAGLDVFMEEPPKDLSLVNHPLVTSTPHLGASTEEAQSRVAVEIAQQFVDANNAKCLFGAINASALTNALSPETAPWVKLGSALGNLARKFVSKVTNKTEIKITTEGASLANASSYLVAAAQVGLLRSDESNGLNLVSAPALAKNLGIKCTCTHSEGSIGGEASVSITVVTDTATQHTVRGYAAGTQPVLHSIDDHVFVQPVLLVGHTAVFLEEATGNVTTQLYSEFASSGASVNGLVFSSTVSGKRWAVLNTTTAYKSNAIENNATAHYYVHL